jgi:hypothetical protein
MRKVPSMIPGRIYEHPIESLLAVVLLLGLLFAATDNNNSPEQARPAQVVANAKS